MSHGPTREYGFTLIELLVVVTIIVVLRALLTPAMDKAIYQAELAVCMSNQDAIVNAGLVYAAAHNKFYPASHAQRAWPYQVNTFVRPWAGYLNVNKAYSCPLVSYVDFEVSDGRSLTIGSYNLWFGWQYAGDRGLKADERSDDDDFRGQRRRYGRQPPARRVF